MVERMVGGFCPGEIKRGISQKSAPGLFLFVLVVGLVVRRFNNEEERLKRWEKRLTGGGNRGDVSKDDKVASSDDGRARLTSTVRGCCFLRRANGSCTV
jgi:hypothetical protein